MSLCVYCGHLASHNVVPHMNIEVQRSKCVHRATTGDYSVHVAGYSPSLDNW